LASSSAGGGGGLAFEEAGVAGGVTVAGRLSRKDRPWKKAPISMASCSWLMSPSTWHEPCSRTCLAVIEPITLPRTSTASAKTPPSTWPVSPMVTRSARTSPLIEPSICSSPPPVTLPSSVMSLANTEGPFLA
jgi:hypothetical protein